MQSDMKACRTIPLDLDDWLRSFESGLDNHPCAIAKRDYRSQEAEPTGDFPELNSLAASVPENGYLLQSLSV